MSATIQYPPGRHCTLALCKRTVLPPSDYYFQCSTLAWICLCVIALKTNTFLPKHHNWHTCAQGSSGNKRLRLGTFLFLFPYESSTFHPTKYGFDFINSF
jgi:hypothetical protein